MKRKPTAPGAQMISCVTAGEVIDEVHRFCLERRIYRHFSSSIANELFRRGWVPRANDVRLIPPLADIESAWQYVKGLAAMAEARRQDEKLRSKPGPESVGTAGERFGMEEERGS